MHFYLDGKRVSTKEADFLKNALLSFVEWYYLHVNIKMSSVLSF